MAASNIIGIALAVFVLVFLVSAVLYWFKKPWLSNRLFEQNLDKDNWYAVLPSYPYGAFLNSGKFKYEINNGGYEDFSFRLIITFRKLSLTV